MSASADLTLDASPAAGTVDLNFSGTQTINALYFGATAKAQGTWGAIGSSAAHQDAAFTGTVSVTAVTITNITATAISYTGGAGAQFVLMKTNLLIGPIMSHDGWQRVDTNTVTPGSFPITTTGNAAFYYIKSE